MNLKPKVHNQSRQYGRKKYYWPKNNITCILRNRAFLSLSLPLQRLKSSTQNMLGGERTNLLNWIGKHGGASLRRCRCLGRVLADKNSNGSLVSVYAHFTQSQRNKLSLNEGGIGAGNETRTRDFHLGKVVIGSKFLQYNQSLMRVDRAFIGCKPHLLVTSTKNSGRRS